MPQELEARVANALRGFKPAPDGAPYDLQNADGTRVLELKTRLQGVRDLDAALLRLSKILADRAGLRQACLLVKLPRVTDDRLRTEWTSLQQVLKPRIMHRLALIAIGREHPWISREDPTLRRIAEAANAAVLSTPHARSDERPSQPTRRFFEVFKVVALSESARLPFLDASHFHAPQPSRPPSATLPLPPDLPRPPPPSRPPHHLLPSPPQVCCSTRERFVTGPGSASRRSSRDGDP